MQFITEGKAKIYHKKQEINKKGQFEQSEVFYNPVQIFNRDLSILVSHFYIKKLKNQNLIPDGGIIVDVLSASGLRAIRYSKEIEDLKIVYSNDISDSAQNLIKQNIDLNDVKNIRQTKSDANLFFENSLKKWIDGDKDYAFNIIDLDPYGSAIPFLDSCIKASLDKTLICCTFTDLKVLSGPDFEKCFYLYGVNKSKTSSYHENALRIVLFSANQIANKYGKYIKPKLSVYSDFYVRVFFEINHSKNECQKSIYKTGMVYNCETCFNIHCNRFAVYAKNNKEKHQNNDQYKNERLKLNRLNIPSQNCDQCNSQFHVNGPVWLDPLNDVEFVKELLEFSKTQEHLASIKKIQGIFQGVIHEQELEQYPYAYQMSRLSKFLKVQIPAIKYQQSAFESLNYKFAEGYIEENTIKTNAPPSVVFDVLKSWKIKQQGSENLTKNFKEGSPQYFAWQKKIENVPDFDFVVKNKRPKFSIFYPNPEPDWGPKKAAKKRIIVDENQQIQVKDVE